jgi:hypothetical protein
MSFINFQSEVENDYMTIFKKLIFVMSNIHVDVEYGGTRATLTIDEFINWMSN